MQSKYPDTVIYGEVLMVYAPYTSFKEMMRLRQPNLTDEDIFHAWLRLLHWCPLHRAEFEGFRQQFPRHRDEIKYSGFVYENEDEYRSAEATSPTPHLTPLRFRDL
jgi:hypothetical protein